MLVAPFERVAQGQSQPELVLVEMIQPPPIQQGSLSEYYMTPIQQQKSLKSVPNILASTLIS